MTLFSDFTKNTELLAERLGVSESFDVVERRFFAAGTSMCFYFVDGFVKDGELQRVMQSLLSMKSLGGAEEVLKALPYIEVERTGEVEKIVRAVLSGQSALISESFGAEAILIDARTYPARSTAEPDSDRVMQGAHDGFVETLVMNTALIRRRIRDPRLTMKHFSIGDVSHTDVVVCYMEGVVDKKVLESVCKELSRVKPKAVTLGFQSLAETLIRRGWWNPFPKIRTTERPDTAAAHVLEGNVLVLVDTSPQAMILPTSIFDYLQQTDDYYFPPLTGTYMRLVRTLILLLSVVVTPLWYLSIEYAERLPEGLAFLLPREPGAVPILLQLLLVEVALDGLKIASMNTPNMLSNSLSVVGALILGDFAIEVGWLCADVIFYMAFVAIANFAQQNYELGYAFKCARVITLLLTAALGIWGFFIGIATFVLMIALNGSSFGRSYLYPLIPFRGRALVRLLFRTKKTDFDEERSVGKDSGGAR